MNVYFIKCCDKNGFTKIGVANDPYERLDYLQTGCPYPLKVVSVIKCRNRKQAYDTEAYLHKIFKRNKVRGEWFNKVNMKFVDVVISRQVEDVHTDPETEDEWAEIEIAQSFNNLTG